MKRLMLMAGAIIALAACGSSQSPAPSSGGASNTGAASGSGGGGGSQVKVTGALTATLDSPHCYTVGSIHAIDAAGTSSEGTSLKLTVTDEKGGKADLLTGANLYVFNRSGGSLTAGVNRATFTGARLVTLTGGSSVTVDGSLSC
jgi:hypothetical protein